MLNNFVINTIMAYRKPTTPPDSRRTPQTKWSNQPHTCPLGIQHRHRPSKDTHVNIKKWRFHISLRYKILRYKCFY